MRLAIVIPAYNAARTLPAVLRRIEAAPPYGLHHIIIVDDGSRDDTAALARTLASEAPRVSVLVRARNGGYGAAMKDGLAQARLLGAEHAASVHADGQYSPEALAGLLGALAAGALDLLQGSRVAGGGALEGGLPLYKYAGNWLLNKLERRVFALPLSDFHSGYLVYGPRALDQHPIT